MKFVPSGVSRAISSQILTGQKHSPTILLVAGSVGVVATAVLAAKATLQLEETLDDIKREMEDVRAAHKNGRIADEDVEKTLLYVRARGYVSLTKLYAPAIGVGIGSIAALTGGHRILSKRNAALTAAYAGLEKSFDEYRERVRREFGDEKELEFRRGLKTETVEDENGKEVEKSYVDINKISMYARIFDESNTNWTREASYNLMFLRAVQNHMNNVLHDRGHVFLNDVYDALGMERSQPGAVVGWVRDNKDSYIDFGMYDFSSEKAREFINGQERSILLDFNVDGVVYDLI